MTKDTTRGDGTGKRPAIHTVVLSHEADKALSALPRQMQVRVIEALDKLAFDPMGAAGVKALQGRDAYRLRVGDYRVIYEIEGGALVVLVLRVAHRREVYR